MEVGHQSLALLGEVLDWWLPPHYVSLCQGWDLRPDHVSVSLTDLNVIFFSFVRENSSFSFQIYFRGTWSICSCRFDVSVGEVSLRSPLTTILWKSPEIFSFHCICRCLEQRGQREWPIRSSRMVSLQELLPLFPPASVNTNLCHSPFPLLFFLFSFSFFTPSFLPALPSSFPSFLSLFPLLPVFTY